MPLGNDVLSHRSGATFSNATVSRLRSPAWFWNVSSRENDELRRLGGHLQHDDRFERVVLRRSLLHVGGLSGDLPGGRRAGSAAGPSFRCNHVDAAGHGCPLSRTLMDDCDVAGLPLPERYPIHCSGGEFRQPVATSGPENGGLAGQHVVARIAHDALNIGSPRSVTSTSMPRPGDVGAEPNPATLRGW